MYDKDERLFADGRVHVEADVSVSVRRVQTLFVVYERMILAVHTRELPRQRSARIVGGRIAGVCPTVQDGSVTSNNDCVPWSYQ